VAGILPGLDDLGVGDSVSTRGLNVAGYIVRSVVDRWEVHTEIADSPRAWVQRGDLNWEVWSAVAVPPMVVDRFETAIVAAVKRIPERHELRPDLRTSNSSQIG